MEYPFLFRGYLVPGYTVVNDARLTTALRKEYGDDNIVPVLLTIRLTHFKEDGECRWLSCGERDVVDGSKVIYSDIYGEYVMPCIVPDVVNQQPESFLLNEEEQPIDLQREIEFYFLSTTPDLTVKVLKTGVELRANRGQGRRLHSLSPQAVKLDSLAYL